MTENLWLALIIAAVVITAFIIFRKQLSRFIFRISREGIDAELDTHAPFPTATNAQSATATAPGVRVSGTTMVGKRSRLDVRHTNADISNTTLVGQEHEVVVAAPDPAAVYLQQQITLNFSINDFRALCVALSIDPDALPGPGLDAQTEALLARYPQRLAEIRAEARRIRPGLEWEL